MLIYQFITYYIRHYFNQDIRKAFLLNLAFILFVKRQTNFYFWSSIEYQLDDLFFSLHQLPI